MQDVKPRDTHRITAGWKATCAQASRRRASKRPTFSDTHPALDESPPALQSLSFKGQASPCLTFSLPGAVSLQENVEPHSS